MTTTAAADDDDLVMTHEQGAANARPPLLVVEPLIRYLDGRRLGRGEARRRPTVRPRRACAGRTPGHSDARCLLCSPCATT